MRRYLFVRNAFQPTLVEFCSVDAELREGEQQNYYWRVFSPRVIIS
jgi:hypothetical protein